MSPPPEDLVERLRKASDFLVSDYGYEPGTVCDEAADLIKTLAAALRGARDALKDGFPARAEVIINAALSPSDDAELAAADGRMDETVLAAVSALSGNGEGT